MVTEQALVWAIGVALLAGVMLGSNLGPGLDQNGVFRATYEEARTAFRAAAVKAGAEVEALPVYGELTIDVALMRGTNEGRLLVHISGTHGTEGFAGSAIQCAALNSSLDNPHGSSLLFVHALNPYGMAKSRRWNENNVDLNRNLLTEAEFKVLHKVNRSDYDSVDAIINPDHRPTIGDWALFYPRALWLTVTRGFGHMKGVIIAGQSHQKRGLFYTGRKLEESHRQLVNYLQRAGLFNSTSHLTLIDVHTGLGASGADTLLVGTKAMKDKVFSSIPHNRGVEALTDDTGQAASGAYKESGGFVASNYPRLFTSAKDVVSLTQEFGTVIPTEVLKALILENAAYHFGTEEDQRYYGRYVRDAFYREKDALWRQRVVEYGLDILQQGLTRQ